VVRTLRDNQFGCLPIVEEGHLLGIVTESDLLRRFLDSNRESVPVVKVGMPIRNFMSVVSPTLAPDDRVARALEIFVDANPSTILIAKKGKAIGILSRSDLMHSMHVPRFHDFEGERERLLARPIAELMTRGILTIDASRDVSEAAAFLTQQGVHSLVVLDQGLPAGTFGPHEVFRAVGSMRAAGRLKDIKTNVVFEIDCHETLRSGLRFLESAGVRGLIVRDGDHPVGVFGQHEALASARLSLETPVEQVMSSRILCLPDTTPSFRAAQQAGALGVDQILVTAQGESCGLASASDFVHLLVQPSKGGPSEDTVDETHIQ
jgi:CBS domain-containing protein